MRRIHCDVLKFHIGRANLQIFEGIQKDIVITLNLKGEVSVGLGFSEKYFFP
jgi:hypothetical protein